MVKQRTPKLKIEVLEEGFIQQPEMTFVQEGKQVMRMHNRSNTRHLSRDKCEQAAGGKTYTVRVQPGRKVHVILRWHPDWQVYEYVHVTTNKKRAYAYLNDTFGSIKDRIGKEAFEKIYKVAEVVAW